MKTSEVELGFTILDLKGVGTLGKENTPGKDMVVRIIMGQKNWLGVGNKFGSIDQKH